MNRHENPAISNRHEFERRAQKMPMAPTPRRSILGWIAALIWRV